MQEREALRAAQDAMLPPTLDGWLALNPAQRAEATWRALRLQWLESQAIGP